MSLSYQEKSIWASLAGMIVIYGYYFTTSGLTGGMTVSFFLWTAALLVGIQIIAQGYLAIRSRVERKDERDLAIDGKAYRNAYFFLMAGVFLMIANGVTGTFFGWPVAGGRSVLFLANLMLLLIVLTEIFKSVTQLVLYRRGV